MQVACIISAYRNPDQLLRLTQRLDAFGFETLIHIDRKHLNSFTRTIEELKRIDSVTVLPSHPVAWGGFGHVAATLKGLAALDTWPPDYTFLLTGQDYPIKPADTIVEYLRAQNGNSVLENFSLPWHFWSHDRGGRDRYERYYVSILGRKIWQLPFPHSRKMPGDLQPYGGSSYWCLSAEAVAYVNEFVAINPEYVRFFKHVRVPDELFFQTILVNSELRKRLTSDHVHYNEWDEGAAHPKLLVSSDLENLKSSRMPFARKFDITIDSAALDQIDEKLIGSPL